MSEEEVSEALFLAASDDPDISVLTWHAVDGKSYFTASVKLRLASGERLEPDLILLVVPDRLWVIEVKGSHADAVGDERKLVRARQELGDDTLLAQVSVRSGRDVRGADIVLAVAFETDDHDRAACEHGVVHLSWTRVKEDVEAVGLRRTLEGLLPSA